MAGNSKNRIKLPLSAYLVYLLLCSLLLTGISFSKYVSSAESSDNARVAIFVAEATGNSGKNLSIVSDRDNPVASYDITVKNKNSNNHISEVSMKYQIKVTLPKDFPDESQMSVKVSGNGKELSGTRTGNICVFNSPNIFSASKEETHNYTLTFTALHAGNVNDSTDYSIKLDVVAEQID